MADMANDLSKNPRVYERLSFRVYDCQRPRLDTEWLLSTLFDASLLSTSKAAGNGGSFFARAHDPDPQGRVSAKWAPVFPRDKRVAFARRSCANNKPCRAATRAFSERHHRSETIKGVAAGLFVPSAQ
jgi:hypothetical protein